MTAPGATLSLVAARARRHPGRWLLTAVGIALATAFAGAVAAEGTIAGDRGARAVLRGLAGGGAVVRVSAQDVVTTASARRATELLRDLGLGAQTEVVLLDPVRLDGIVVRPAAIAPIGRWSTAAGSPGRCTTAACPLLIASGAVGRDHLSAAGIAFEIAGRTEVRSAAPLGFTPGQPRGRPPLLLGGDPAGLDALPALSSGYRTHSWLAALPLTSLHAWQLAGLERRLQQTQDALLAEGGAFTLSAPFAGLDRARALASAAGRRLLLAGGGALAAIALFVVLAASGLRRDVDAELGRLRTAGARGSQLLGFVAAEAALLCAAALLAGAALAIGVAAVLAGSAGLPVGAVLDHSLLTGTTVAVLVVGWLSVTALITVLLLAGSARAGDLLALAAVAALALAFTRGSGGSSDPLPVLLAPLACLAAGVLVYRGAAALLRGGERLSRRGPVLARLAFVGLARAPAGPALAIAFIAVSTGLGAFALSYRATLLRSDADQAANQVPLDATVAAGSDFTTPLELASAAAWRSLSGAAVIPVRRTDASYVSGGSSVAVPALGVPAAALARIHGWRSGDGPAPLATLARSLAPSGPTRVAGPPIPPAARSVTVRASAPGIAIELTALLRDPSGAVHPLALGTSSRRPALLRARLPARRAGGAWELEALQLTEPAGLEATDGHQNAENVAAATRFVTTLRLGRLTVADGAGRALAGVRLGRWRAIGASAVQSGRGAGTAVRFDASGRPGLLRPLQPSDLRPTPVLVDPRTAAAAGHSGFLPLTVDGVPVSARVAGVLRRFPTVPAAAAGFVVADEQALAGALDAQTPGQGRADELWFSARSARSTARRLHGVLARAPYSQLSLSVRGDVERRLRAGPIPRSIVGTLLAAAGLCGALAIAGLLVALLGAARDERIERDLVAQGVGPRGVRRELRLRLALAAVLGVLTGAVIGVVLTRLAVSTVQASDAGAIPHPALVAVAPWGELAASALLALVALLAAGWVATRSAAGRALA